MAADVLSQNVVGYVNKEFVGGAKYTLVANPLVAATNTVNGLLGSTLPNTSKVLKWGGASFTIYQRTATGWLPNGNATLNPGEGFFVFVPAGTNTLTCTFVGEVLQGNLTNAYSLLFNLSGNKFPDSGLVSTMQLTNVPTGDKLYLWKTNTQSYTIHQKTASSWLPSVPSLTPGDGFFINTPSGTFNWVRNVTVQ